MAALYLLAALRLKAKVQTFLWVGVVEMEVIERVARVLAGQYFSRNAAGAAGDDDASTLVDQNWVDFLEDAVAVLKTLRAPPASLQNESDAALWGLVIQSVLGPHAHD